MRSFQFLVLISSFAACGDGETTGATNAVDAANAPDATPEERCRPSGYSQALPDVNSETVRIEGGLLLLKSPETDCSAFPLEPAYCGGRAQFRLEKYSDSFGIPPIAPETLEVFVNGCPIEHDANSETSLPVWENATLGGLDIEAAPGKFMIVEIEQDNQVIIRRSYQLPGILPKMIRPTPGVALGGPFELEWEPLVDEPSLDTFGLQPLSFEPVDPIELPATAGQYSVPSSDLEWKVLELFSYYRYQDPGVDIVRVIIEHSIPVN